MKLYLLLSSIIPFALSTPCNDCYDTHSQCTRTHTLYYTLQPFTLTPTTTSTLTPTTTSTLTPTTTSTLTPTTTSTLTPTTTSTTTPTTLIPTFITNVLDMHNKERSLVGVPPLTWSNSMYTIAQSWSDTLTSQNCNLVHTLNGESRQNLFAGFGWSNPDTTGIPASIDAWLSEKSLVGKPGVTFEENGHYLNIIANDISSVGCALSINSNSNCFVVTCDYI